MDPATLRSFRNPNAAKRLATTPTPLAIVPEAFLDVIWLPFDPIPVGQGHESDAIAVAGGLEGGLYGLGCTQHQ